MGHADGVFQAAVRHGEVAGLGCLVSGLVTKRYCHRVRTVDKLHLIVDIPVAGRNSGALCYINAVYIELHGIGIHARFIFAIRIAEMGAQVKGTSGNRTAVYQLLVVDGDGGHLRISHIVYIRAVHKLEIVKVNRTGCKRSHVILPAHIHQPQGHTLTNGVRRGQVCQISFQIFPTRPIDSRLCPVPVAIFIHQSFRLKGEIIRLHIVRWRFQIAAQPKSRLRIATIFIQALICDADTLRGIDPHTDTRGCAVHREVHLCADTRAFRYCFRTTSEVVIQLQGFLAKTHRLAVSAADDLDAFLSAASIVAVSQDAFFTAVILLRRLRNTAAVIRLVLKVPHHYGKHTDHDLDRVVYGLIKRRGGGNVCRYAARFCGSENITCETTHVRLFHRPHDVTVLVVHVPHLVAHHQAQIGLFLKVQADLIGVEGDHVRLHQFHRGSADHGVALAQRHGDSAYIAIIGRRKQTGGRVDRAQLCGLLRHLPHQAVGQVRSTAAAVHAYRAELHRRAGGIQLLTGADHGVVKHTVLSNGRNAEEAGADGTLVTVGGLAEHFQFVTLFAGGKGGRAAAVEVQRRHAAGILQDRRHLIAIHTDGAGRQTALCHEKDHAAVRPDTHAVAGVHCAVSGHLDLAVLQQVERTGNGLHHVVRRRSGVADDRRAVRQNGKVGLIGGLDHVALHDQVARGFTGAHVEVVTIGGHDHRARRVGDGAVVRRQLGGLLHAPLAIPDRLRVGDAVRSGAAFGVVAIVGGLEGHVLGQIDLGHVADGLLIIAVSHDDLVVSHTIGNGVVGLRNRCQARRGSGAAQCDRALHGGLRGERRQDIHLVLAVVPLRSRLCLVGILGNVRFFPCAFRSCDVLVAPVTGFFLSVRVNQGNFCVFCLSRAVLDREGQRNDVQQE